MTVISKVAEYVKCDHCGAAYVTEEAGPSRFIRIWSCRLAGGRQRWLDLCVPDCAVEWLVKTHVVESEST